MAEKLNKYYRTINSTDGIIGPVFTKQQLINQIEISLLAISDTIPEIQFTITSIELTSDEYANRDEGMREGEYMGSVN